MFPYPYSSACSSCSSCFLVRTRQFSVAVPLLVTCSSANYRFFPLLVRIKLSPKQLSPQLPVGKPTLLCSSAVLAAAGEGIREQMGKQPEKLVLSQVCEMRLQESFKQHLSRVFLIPKCVGDVVYCEQSYCGCYVVHYPLGL